MFVALTRIAQDHMQLDFLFEEDLRRYRTLSVHGESVDEMLSVAAKRNDSCACWRQTRRICRSPGSGPTPTPGAVAPIEARGAHGNRSRRGEAGWLFEYGRRAFEVGEAGGERGLGEPGGQGGAELQAV
jgi:hypothetical protein